MEDNIRDINGKWLDSSVFRPAAIKYVKDGYYCGFRDGTQEWFDFWKEERRRCIEGYSVEGHKITGDHYFYLNYCPIMKAESKKNTKVGAKIKGFPDFWDGDYNYFWSREIARNGVRNLVEDIDVFDELSTEEKLKVAEKEFKKLRLFVEIKPKYLFGGHDLIVGKARRRGYSYKAASIAACNFFHRPNSYTLLLAYDSKYLYPKGLFTMARKYIDFVNDNTAWTMPSDVINTQKHIKASYYEYKDGVRVEKGFLSEIQALSANDNSDASRGKDGYDVFIEESGAFGVPGLLKKLVVATNDVVRAGAIKTGLITIFGTSGDMEGGTADYADMHKKPEAFDALPFVNIWDPNSKDYSCGFFHPINWNTEGYYDEQGNSDIEGAIQYELNERKRLVASGASSDAMQLRKQERPLGPKEAFGLVSSNNFPIEELSAQLAKVEGNNWHKIKGTPVDLLYDGNTVKAIPILDSKVSVVDSLSSIPIDVKSKVIIYEYPVENAPKGLYKIGYDPVRQDVGTSFAAIIVFKGVYRGSYTKNCIVAEYVGRRGVPEDMDRIAEMLAVFYNTTVMHENEVTGVKNYFRRIKRLDLLAAQPDRVISKNIKKSKVSRVYGCHMTTQLKEAGERYIKEWLLNKEDFDEEGKPIRNIDRIYSRRLLEELISYNRKGNFDLVSALIMAMFQVQEESLDMEYDEDTQTKDFARIAEFYGQYQQNIN